MFLPGTASNVAGDFLFVSTIYPIDDFGVPVLNEGPSPHVGRSLMAAQTGAILVRCCSDISRPFGASCKSQCGCTFSTS
jgi:hypothetical protein